MDRKAEIQKQGKHKIEDSTLRMEKEFFRNYDGDMTEEEAKERYAGMYGTDRGYVIPKSQLQRIWKKFILEERIDYITMNNTVSVEEIISIGIDKFVRTNGWMRPGDVPKWRTNVARVGKCPECSDQFIPLLMQTNHGLCNNCRPKFSVKAIKRFVEHTIATNERYFMADKDALMDFYVMFYNDPAFRKLFVKDTESAHLFETREYEIPEWFKEQQAKDIEAMNRQMLDSIPETKNE